MLSKEEKLRYGEILRQQMKEKQERKRIEDLSKRQVPIPKTISAPTIVPDPSIYLSQPSPDPKEQLQKQLEKQDYNPFGKAGGGAPNRRQPQTVTANEPNYSQLAQQSAEYGGLPMEQRYPSQQMYDPRQGYRPQFAEQPRMQEPQRQYQDYPPAVSPQSYQRKQPDPVRYEPSAYEQPQRYEPQQQPQRFQPPQQRYQPPPPQPQRFQPPPPQPQRFQPAPPQLVPGYELPPESDQLQQMYRRGGRNLLKLQNETANEHIVKQRQKLEMQAFLKQQMEEAERRKQEEKDRLKREEIEEERRNREYIQLQNFKLREEERRKQEEKQRIVDENARNLAKRKELQQQAKEKLQRQERQRQEAANRRQPPPPQRQPRHQPSPAPLPLPRHESDSSSLTSSSATVTHQNFNTDISKQFFKQEREATRPPDRKLELVTAEIERMRAEISNQGDMFQQELHRIKLQAELAQQEKMKAELEIERLKLELERKNQEAELRLMQAVKRNDPYQQSAKFNGYNYDQQPQRPQPPNYHNHSNPTPQPNYNQDNYQDNNNSFHSPPSQPPQNRPMPKQTRVPEYQPTQKSYSAKGKLQDLDYHPKLEESGVATLQADSKKIPINLPANRQLTLSKIEHYGKDNSYYQQEPQRRLPKPYPIPEEEEEERPRVKSRQNGEDRPRMNSRQSEDELDRFVQSRGQNKWEMSTVKDDFNKQIEELLKQKDYRPQGSQMSQAGRQILSRGGLPYDGPNLNSLNSNKQSLVSNGTVDVDKIHDRNEARLRQLRALGVETINTTNDEDLNRLDAVLKNYR